MHRNQQLLKIRQIQRNKIFDAILKSIKGLLKEVHVSVHASVKTTSVFQRIGVSVLVPEDSSAFFEAIILQGSINLL